MSPLSGTFVKREKSKQNDNSRGDYITMCLATTLMPFMNLIHLIFVKTFPRLNTCTDEINHKTTLAGLTNPWLQTGAQHCSNSIVSCFLFHSTEGLCYWVLQQQCFFLPHTSLTPEAQVFPYYQPALDLWSVSLLPGSWVEHSLRNSVRFPRAPSGKIPLLSASFLPSSDLNYISIWTNF